MSTARQNQPFSGRIRVHTCTQRQNLHTNHPPSPRHTDCVQDLKTSQGESSKEKKKSKSKSKSRSKSKRNRIERFRVKKFNNIVLDKLAALLGYTVQSADKLAKAVLRSGLPDGVFITQLYLSDRDNLLKCLSQMSPELISANSQSVREPLSEPSSYFYCQENPRQRCPMDKQGQDDTVSGESQTQATCQNPRAMREADDQLGSQVRVRLLQNDRLKSLLCTISEFRSDGHDPKQYIEDYLRLIESQERLSLRIRQHHSEPAVETELESISSQIQELERSLAQKLIGNREWTEKVESKPGVCFSSQEDIDFKALKKIIDQKVSNKSNSQEEFKESSANFNQYSTALEHFLNETSYEIGRLSKQNTQLKSKLASVSEKLTLLEQKQRQTNFFQMAESSSSISQRTEFASSEDSSMKAEINLLKSELRICKNNFRAFFDVTKNIVVRGRGRQIDEQTKQKISDISVSECGKLETGMELLIKELETVIKQNKKLTNYNSKSVLKYNQSCAVIEESISIEGPDVNWGQNLSASKIEEMENVLRQRELQIHQFQEKVSKLAQENNESTQRCAFLQIEISSRESQLEKAEKLLERVENNQRQLKSRFDESQDELQECQRQRNLKVEENRDLEAYIQKIESELEEIREDKYQIEEAVTRLERRKDTDSSEREQLVAQLQQMELREKKFEDSLAERAEEVAALRDLLAAERERCVELQEKQRAAREHCQSSQHSLNLQQCRSEPLLFVPKNSPPEWQAVLMSKEGEIEDLEEQVRELEEKLENNLELMLTFRNQCNEMQNQINQLELRRNEEKQEKESSGKDRRKAFREGSSSKESKDVGDKSESKVTSEDKAADFSAFQVEQTAKEESPIETLTHSSHELGNLVPLVSKKQRKEHERKEKKKLRLQIHSPNQSSLICLSTKSMTEGPVSMEEKAESNAQKLLESQRIRMMNEELQFKNCQLNERIEQLETELFSVKCSGSSQSSECSPQRQRPSTLEKQLEALGCEGSHSRIQAANRGDCEIAEGRQQSKGVRQGVDYTSQNNPVDIHHSQVSDSGNELDTIKEYEDSFMEINTRLKSEHFEGELSAVLRDLKNEREKADMLSREIALSNQKSSELEASNRKLSEETEHLEKKLHELRSREEEQALLLSSLRDENQSAKQKVEELQREVQRLQQQLKHKEESLKSAQAIQLETVEEKDKLQGMVAEYSLRVQEYNQMHLEHLESEQNLQLQVEALTLQIQNLQKGLQESEQHQGLHHGVHQELRDQLIQVKDRNQQLKAQLEQKQKVLKKQVGEWEVLLELEREIVLSKETELMRLQEQIRDYQQRLKRAQQQIAALREQLQKSTKQCGECHELKKQCQEFEQAVRKLSDYREGQSNQDLEACSKIKILDSDDAHADSDEMARILESSEMNSNEETHNITSPLQKTLEYRQTLRSHPQNAQTQRQCFHKSAFNDSYQMLVDKLIGMSKQAQRFEQQCLEKDKVVSELKEYLRRAQCTLKDQGETIIELRGTLEKEKEVCTKECRVRELLIERDQFIELITQLKFKAQSLMQIIQQNTVKNEDTVKQKDDYIEMLQSHIAANLKKLELIEHQRPEDHSMMSETIRQSEKQTTLQRMLIGHRTQILELHQHLRQMQKQWQSQIRPSQKNKTTSACFKQQEEQSERESKLGTEKSGRNIADREHADLKRDLNSLRAILSRRQIAFASIISQKDQQIRKTRIQIKKLSNNSSPGKQISKELNESSTDNKEIEALKTYHLNRKDSIEAVEMQENTNFNLQTKGRLEEVVIEKNRLHLLSISLEAKLKSKQSQFDLLTHQNEVLKDAYSRQEILFEQKSVELQLLKLTAAMQEKKLAEAEVHNRCATEQRDAAFLTTSQQHPICKPIEPFLEQKRIQVQSRFDQSNYPEVGSAGSEAKQRERETSPAEARLQNDFSTAGGILGGGQTKSMLNPHISPQVQSSDIRDQKTLQNPKARLQIRGQLTELMPEFFQKK